GVLVHAVVSDSGQTLVVRCNGIIQVVGVIQVVGNNCDTSDNVIAWVQHVQVLADNRCNPITGAWQYLHGANSVSRGDRTHVETGFLIRMSQSQSWVDAHALSGRTDQSLHLAAARNAGRVKVILVRIRVLHYMISVGATGKGVANLLLLD